MEGGFVESLARLEGDRMRRRNLQSEVGTTIAPAAITDEPPRLPLAWDPSGRPACSPQSPRRSSSRSTPSCSKTQMKRSPLSSASSPTRSIIPLFAVTFPLCRSGPALLGWQFKFNASCTPALLPLSLRPSSRCSGSSG